MRRNLSSRERRIAALAILALLLWAAWSLLIDSWFSGPLAEMASEAATLREQQQHNAGLLQQRPALQAALQQAHQDPASRSSLLPGDDPSAVAADLMQHSVDIVKARASLGAGCEVTQRMPITPEQDRAEPYRQVKVSLTLDCAMEPLANVLHDFEYGQPVLFVDSLSVRRASTAPSSGGAGRLQVHLVVRGYLQPSQPEQKSTSVSDAQPQEPQS
ncbi:type II secretion system protein GspM [Pseudomonas sp.]|uniref:type II secretion system protein GspM n=1 Tax=Pseudomonas sp. TaxID=306 RepID=UPI002603C0CB|nr:type II secretion system protein GspM [Pseudomonas sp.]